MINHDNSGSTNDHLPPGDGKIDWAQLLQDLEGSIFTGCLFSKWRALSIHSDDGQRPLVPQLSPTSGRKFGASRAVTRYPEQHHKNCVVVRKIREASRQDDVFTGFKEGRSMNVKNVITKEVPITAVSNERATGMPRDAGCRQPVAVEGGMETPERKEYRRLPAGDPFWRLLRLTTFHPANARKAALLAASTAVLLFIFQVSNPTLPAHWTSPARVDRSAERPVLATTLPFSFDDVTNYFTDALGGLPNDRHPNYALFKGGTVDEGLFSITIIQRGSEILVRFHVIDDYGMNFIREFFEAPFFQRNETEQLYGLFYMDEGLHCATLPRFDVLLENDTRSDATFVTLFFSQPVRIVR